MFCRETAVIFLLRKLPVRMVFAKQRTKQGALRQIFHIGQIHLQPLQVHVNNGGEFLLRKYRFGHHGVQHRQGFAAVTVQRVKRYDGVLHGAGQLQPCPIVIEFRSNFGRCVAGRAFAQHAVGKKRLKQGVLTQLSRFKHQVDAAHFLFAAVDYTERNTVGKYVRTGF